PRSTLFPYTTLFRSVKVVLAPTADNAFFVPAAFDIEQHLDMAESYASTADVLYISNDNLSIEATRAGLFLDLAPLAAGDPDLNPDRKSTRLNSSHVK